MIINNQNLPYNLRISQNEPIIEIKETGEIVNLARPTADGARSLTDMFFNWIRKDPPAEPPTPAITASEGQNLAEQFAAFKATIADLKTENDSLKEQLAATASDPDTEPNPEEISSSPAKDEELI